MLLNDFQELPTGGNLETENSPKQGVFARFERKYFLPRINAAQFKEQLLKHMSPSYPAPGTEFTEIESVYFDSPDFRIYQMHFSSQRGRFKVRARRYAPNGMPAGGDAHLELKSKDSGVSRKSRFQIGREERGALWNGELIAGNSKALRAKNPDLTAQQLEERADRINDLILLNKLRPSCIVRYRREAFERGSLRLTIDDRIDFEATQNFTQMRQVLRSDPKLSEEATRMRSTYRNGEFLLVEVKHPGVVPSELMEILDASGCRKAKFSKYCYSITEAILGGTESA